MHTIHEAVITAYCICAACCGKYSPERGGAGLTFSGERPVERVTVAGPRRWPIGTVVRIDVPGWGQQRLVVQDRTAEKYDGRWDVFHGGPGAHQRALNFGRKTATVTIISVPTTKPKTNKTK